jgi:hypothetical protein
LLGAELNAAIYYPVTVDDAKERKHEETNPRRT